MIRAVEGSPDSREYFAARGLQASSWSVGPGTVFAAHAHAHTKHLFVVHGSISFNGAWLHAPAGIVIDAGTEHEAVAGDAGVECVEAFEESRAR